MTLQQETNIPLPLLQAVNNLLGSTTRVQRGEAKK